MSIKEQLSVPIKFLKAFLDAGNNNDKPFCIDPDWIKHVILLLERITERDTKLYERVTNEQISVLLEKIERNRILKQSFVSEQAVIEWLKEVENGN